MKSLCVTVAAVALAVVMPARTADASLAMDWNNFGDGIAYFGGPLLPTQSQNLLGTWTYRAVAHTGSSSDISTYAASWALGLNSGGLVSGTDSVLDTRVWTYDGVFDWGEVGNPGPSTIDATGNGGRNIYILISGTYNSVDYYGYVWASAWTLGPDSPNPAITLDVIFDRSAGVADGGTTIIGANDGWAAVSAVPEPGTMALLALGIGAVALRRKVTG